MATLEKTSIQARIDELRPWRYNHTHGDIRIISDNPATSGPDEKYARKLMRGIVTGVIGKRDAGALRALDLGCLEGHYSDMLCSMGFKEVVSVDLSAEHIKRATFLLKDLKGYANSTIVLASATDEEAMGDLGKFDVILFHGLLYHLKDPLQMFDILDRLLSGPDSCLLLATQFKGRFAPVISPIPMAEIQIKGLKSARKGSKDELLFFSPHDGSVFERCSMRLNPAGLYATLQLYGFKEILTYDSPGGHTYSNNVSLIAFKTPRPDVLPALQSTVKIEGVKFYPWRGDTVDSFHFSEIWHVRIVRALMWLGNKAVSLYGKILMRLG